MRFLVLLLLTLTLSASAADMVVQGLFKGAVLLNKDGEQKLVRAGATWNGVTVIEADAKQAIVEIDGERQTVTLSRRIAATYKAPLQKTVRVRKNDAQQYITNALINGRATSVLVDTGATTVAMSSDTARSLGIDYEKGTPGRVQTASGVAAAYSIVLNEVSVGEITVHHVRASVVEGAYPETVLLSMSYLRHVEMQEKDGVLMLIGKF